MQLTNYRTTPGARNAGGLFATLSQPLDLQLNTTLAARQAQHLVSRFGVATSIARVLSQHAFGNGGMHE
jgi:hypothetical protein